MTMDIAPRQHRSSCIARTMPEYPPPIMATSHSIRRVMWPLSFIRLPQLGDHLVNLGRMVSIVKEGYYPILIDTP